MEEEEESVLLGGTRGGRGFDWPGRRSVEILNECIFLCICIFSLSTGTLVSLSRNTTVGVQGNIFRIVLFQ